MGEIYSVTKMFKEHNLKVVQFSRSCNFIATALFNNQSLVKKLSRRILELEIRHFFILFRFIVWSLAWKI